MTRTRALRLQVLVLSIVSLLFSCCNKQSNEKPPTEDTSNNASTVVKLNTQRDVSWTFGYDNGFGGHGIENGHILIRTEKAGPNRLILTIKNVGEDNVTIEGNNLFQLDGDEHVISAITDDLVARSPEGYDKFFIDPGQTQRGELRLHDKTDRVAYRPRSDKGRLTCFQLEIK